MRALERLSSDWAHARAAHETARLADWHPDKEAQTAAAYAKCQAAARAYNRAWIVEHAPEYAAAHNIVA